MKLKYHFKRFPCINNKGHIFICFNIQRAAILKYRLYKQIELLTNDVSQTLEKKHDPDNYFIKKNSTPP